MTHLLLWGISTARIKIEFQAVALYNLPKPRCIYVGKKTPTRYYSLNVCLGNPLTLFYQGQWNFMLRPSEFTLAATGNLREIFPSWKLLSEASPITDICFYLILLWNIFFSMECHLRCIFYVCKLFVIRTYIYL